MVLRNAILAATLAVIGCSPTSFAMAAAMASAKPIPQKVTPAISGPPTVNSVYVSGNCEGEGGCPYRNWRTSKKTPILGQRVNNARVIGTLVPGEWVHVEAVEMRLVPRRGILRADAGGLRAGEVIYELEYEGEGFTTIWHRGELSILDYDAPVDWEDSLPPPDVAATLGLWAKVKRKNGQIGWVHDPSFECMGPLAGDEGCRN